MFQIIWTIGYMLFMLIVIRNFKKLGEMSVMDIFILFALWPLMSFVALIFWCCGHNFKGEKVEHKPGPFL